MSVASPGPQAAREPTVEAARKAFAKIRSFSERLCATLNAEDMVVQSMPDASPLRWHLAHTTWFFETFILKEFAADFRPFHERFEFLFNSYYNAVGDQFTRADRGLLTRPTVGEVFEYRDSINAEIGKFLDTVDDSTWARASHIFQVGLQHEQQHQELMLTDIKHLLSRNPLAPAFQEMHDSAPSHSAVGESGEVEFRRFEESVAWVGHEGDGFCYDNEMPRHRQLVEAFEIANRLTTNGEYLAFINGRGYERPEYWLSMGWQMVQQLQWQLPIYWVQTESGWSEFTLSGLKPLDLEAPVCHLSYFEADAFARWSDARLPREAEWEIASEDCEIEGNFVDQGHLHPRRATREGSSQMFGDCWEWTCSPYVGYPGYRAPSGAIGEYNGKFMCNQYVLRGGSVATSQSHMRRTYRNFFPPDARWQFTSVRLARDISG